MPVIRERRQYVTQPTGVVRAGADAFGVTTGIGELADSLIQSSYKQLIDEAQKKGTNLARTVSETKFKTLNPATGEVEILKAPSSFGTAAANAYQEAIEARYVASLETDIKNYAAQNFARYENDRDGYAKFELGLTEQIQTLIDETDPRFKELTQAMGASLLGSYKANFLQKDVARKQQDTINSNISIVDNNLRVITDGLTQNEFDVESLNTEDGQAIISESFEQAQGIIDGNMHIAHNILLMGDAEAFNLIREKNIKALSGAIQNALATITNESGTEEDLYAAKIVLMSNGDGVENLPLPYRTLIEQAMSLKISGNDTYLDEETGELVYDEGSSKRLLLPFIAEDLRQTINQAIPAIRDREARELQVKNELERKQEELDIIQFDEKTGPDFQQQSIESVREAVVSGNIVQAFDVASNLYTDYSNQVNDLKETADKKARRKSVYKGVLINNLLNGIAQAGEPATLTTSEGKQISSRTITFSPSEVDSINQWLTTGGENYDLLPENLKQPIKQYMEFAGEDRTYAINQLQEKVNVSSQLYSDSITEVKSVLQTQSIMQGTANPSDTDTHAQFDQMFVMPNISDSNPDDVYTDAKNNKAILSGNVYLNPEYIENTAQINSDMVRTGLMSKQLIDAFRLSTQTQLDPRIQANIFNTMRQLDTTIDGTGRSRNILKRSLSPDDYNLYKAIEAGVNIRGTSNLPQVLSDVRELSADPEALLVKKKSRYGNIINAELKPILKKPLTFANTNNDQMNSIIMKAAFLRYGIKDNRVQSDLLNRFAPYIDLHVSAGGDSETLFDAIGVYYESYYKPTDGLIVDPYNPASDVSTFSFGNKRIGQDKKSKTQFVSNSNKYLDDQGINAHIGSVSSHFVDGNKHNLAFSVGGMPAVPATKDVQKSLQGKERIYLMPIAGEPFGYSQYLDPDSQVKGMTENTVYIGVVKNEVGEFSPYIYESADGLTAEDKKAGLTGPKMMIFQYSDLEQIGFAEEDRIAKVLEKKQIDFANYLRQAVNASNEDWLTPYTAKILLDAYEPSVD